VPSPLVRRILTHLNPPGHEPLLDLLDPPLHLHWLLERSRPPVRARAQTPHLRTHRRDRREPDVQFTGVYRWDAELGLSVLVDKGFELYVVCVDKVGVYVGGEW
jgi:hypothetical protein